MGKHCQLIMGPAGSGKSTYCHAIQDFCTTVKRSVHCINLDPAAEHIGYPITIDIRDLITLDDVAEELELGPNGGLITCMEYLIENFDWLEEQIGDHDDDYLLFDCPGQIELYCHIPVMRKLAKELDRIGYQICAVYLIDSLFVTDGAKFLSGILACMSAMIQLELPHINILSKIDLLKDPDTLERFLDPDPDDVLRELKNGMDKKYFGLTKAIAELIESYNMVGFIPFSAADEERIEVALTHIDHAIQYGEDREPKIPRDPDD